MSWSFSVLVSTMILFGRLSALGVNRGSRWASLKLKMTPARSEVGLCSSTVFPTKSGLSAQDLRSMTSDQLKNVVKVLGGKPKQMRKTELIDECERLLNLQSLKTFPKVEDSSNMRAIPTNIDTLELMQSTAPSTTVDEATDQLGNESKKVSQSPHTLSAWSPGSIDAQQLNRKQTVPLSMANPPRERGPIRKQPSHAFNTDRRQDRPPNTQSPGTNQDLDDFFPRVPSNGDAEDETDAEKGHPFRKFMSKHQNFPTGLVC